MTLTDRILTLGLFCIGALLLAAGPVAVLSAGPPQTGTPVLVIAADPVAAIHDAGANVIGPITAPFAALAVAPDIAALTRLEAGTAWVLRDATRLAEFCGLAPGGQSRLW